jgi:hypothetical protein
MADIRLGTIGDAAVAAIHAPYCEGLSIYGNRT